MRSNRARWSARPVLPMLLSTTTRQTDTSSFRAATQASGATSRLPFQLCRWASVLFLFACITAGAQNNAVEGARSPKTAQKPHGKGKHDKDRKALSAATITSDENGVPADPNKSDEQTQSVYAFGLPTADGKNLPLSDYKGKVLLVVNLARQSSYASQLPALEKLNNTFKDKGLVVLGVPSNDFGNAEPGTSAEITKYYADAKVTFPVMQMSTLTGVHQLPLFSYLTKNKAIDNDGLHWNYTKFLVDRKGKVIVCFSPEVAPDSLAMMATVEEVLDGTWKPKKSEGKHAADEVDDEE